MNINPPLKPKNGQTLKVVGICRISTLNQDVRSLADQKAGYEEYLRNHYDGPFDITPIQSQGSGEWKDRPELETLAQHTQAG